MIRYLLHILRPWKFVTFLLGTAFFVWGALFFALPTWDVGVSILMSVLCYLIAPWAVDLGVRAIRDRPPRWPLTFGVAAAAVYFVGSGSYEIYNTIRMGYHPVTYWANLFFSVPVTIIAGLLWRYDGSLGELVADVRQALAERDRKRERPPG